MPVYTWNMEHGGDRWPMLNNFNDADAICLQETSAYTVGLALGGIHAQTTYSGQYQIGSHFRGKKLDLLVAWFKTGMNSVAVMVDGAINQDLIPPPQIGTRSTPGLLHGASGVWVFSIHAPSNGGSAWQMGWIQTVLAQIDNLAGGAQWICAGDYNAAPAAVHAIRPPNTVVIHANAPTQKSGGELDFAVCTPGVINSAEVGSGFNSDHWPVKFS